MVLCQGIKCNRNYFCGLESISAGSELPGIDAASCYDVIAPGARQQTINILKIKIRKKSRKKIGILLPCRSDEEQNQCLTEEKHWWGEKDFRKTGTIQQQAQEPREFLVPGSDCVKPFCRAAVKVKISKRRVDLEFPHGNFGSSSYSQGISAHVFSLVTGSSANNLSLNPWPGMSYWEQLEWLEQGLQQPWEFSSEKT